MEQNVAAEAPEAGEEILPWRDPEFIRAPWPWFDRVLRDFPFSGWQTGRSW